MSTRYERRAADKRREGRRKIEEIFAQGRGLAAAGDTPDRPGIRQMVYMRREPDGAASVHVEHYSPNQWDHTIDETKLRFLTFAEALEWIESHCGITWSELHEPAPPSIQ